MRRPTRPSPGPRVVTTKASAAVTVGIATAIVALVACGGPDTSGAAFCTALEQRMPLLTGPVVDQPGVDALVDAYEGLDDRTPLAIEQSWHDLTTLVVTVATVSPDDPASVQLVTDTAYATERSAREVATWVEQTCGFSMPAMAGIEGPVTTPPTTKAPKRDKPATTEP